MAALTVRRPRPARRSGRRRGGPGRGRRAPAPARRRSSWAFQQRVRNRQPDGGSTGLGTSPSSTMRLRARSRVGVGQRDGRQQRLRVRVAGPLVDRRRGCRSSTILPRYITATRSEMWRTTRQVVGDEHVGQAELVLQLLEQVDDAGLDRHVERRHRLVEHDQLRLEGEGPGDADALALAAGELVRVPVGVLGRQADERAAARAPGRGLLACSAAVDLQRLGRASRPTVMRGLSEAYGSWNTIWNRWRSCAQLLALAGRRDVLPVEARPSPEVGRIRSRSSRPVVDLPQPDSPTRPSVSPRCDVEATRRTRPAPWPTVAAEHAAADREVLDQVA